MGSRIQPLTSMNSMQYKDATVKVRVVRLWFVPPYSSNMSKPNPGAVAIQMVLCDSENSTIGASVPSMCLNKFKGSLVEGGVFFISRFGVGQSGGNFRITTHAFKINFLFGTHDKTLVDVIGLLTNIGDIIQSSKDDVSSKRSRVSATLWGHYCDQIEKFMIKHKEGVVLIALQYCKIKVFNGQRSLSNSMHATRSSSSSVKSVSRYADPFTTVSISCISELLLSSDDCSLYHSRYMSTTIPRFRIELVVIDDTAPANFTLFDRDAANFLGVSAEFMKNKAEKVDDDSMQSLAEFDKFLGIRFVFKVGVKLATWSPTPLITVQAMSWDQDLIKKLSAESPLHVSPNDDNGDTNIGSSFSQDVIAEDVYGENLTPNQEADKFALNKVPANPNNTIQVHILDAMLMLAMNLREWILQY
ncbi:replication protein A 70 kDa DNA-binding subunit C-like [Senna tora]|uniref:Replication protein A 70 kDa DNA-binding subunit C-like n=1 Tax=Senna tora TaxID=362788 RepID=A0A834W6R7_9FABA|nr:replication protein A 70 kDa DNA-binding subunit C-like [Senna tora]